jgi:hypothetical protein
LCLAGALLLLTSCQEVTLGNLVQDFGLTAPQAQLDDGTITRGLREALAVGTQRAVQNVSRQDGYFGNQLIKVLMPEKMRNVAELLGKVGMQRQVDEFVLSMNRAAEKAAPKAAGFFADAVREMTFADARGILQGGDTAATEFFRGKTAEKIQNAFKPVVSDSMNQVGTTQAFKKVMGSYAALPFTPRVSFDLDQYVTAKAVDGLFHMLGEEEKKIRTDPAARATELLRTVFGRRG